MFAPSETRMSDRSGIQTQFQGIAAVEGSRFLTARAGCVVAQQLLPAMQPDTRYHVQAWVRSRLGCRARIYFASALDPRADPKGGTRFLPLRGSLQGMTSARWDLIAAEYDSAPEDIGKPLHVVLEAADPTPPAGFVAWDQVFFRQMPRSTADAAQEARRTIPRDAAAGHAILSALQAFVDALEPAPDNQEARGDAYSQMGTAAARGLGDWELAETCYGESLRHYNLLRQRHPGIWRHHNNALWVENELFIRNWRIGKLGVCKKILDRCRPVRNQLVDAIGHADPGREYRDMLRTVDYGKWRVDRMEVNFLEVSGHAREALGRLDEMIAEMESAARLSPLAEGNRNQFLWTCGLASILCVDQGKYRQALSYAERISEGKASRQPVSIAAQAGSALFAAEARMRAEGASDALWQQAREAYRSATNDLEVVRTFGVLHLIAGDPAAAIPYLDQALAIAHRTGMRQFLRRTLRYRAEAKLALGLVTEAAEDLVEALTVSRELADKTQEVALYQLYGRCADRKGACGIAFESWSIALDLAAKFNMPHLALDVRCDIAELQAALGLVDELAGSWRQIDGLMDARPDIADCWADRAERLRPLHRDRCARAARAAEIGKIPYPAPPAADPPPPSPPPAAPAIPAAPPPEQVRLQPALIQSRLVEGEIPAARFILFNASPAEGRGTVSARADGRALSMRQEEGQLVFRFPEAEAAPPEEDGVPLSIAPGEARSIVVEAPPSSGQEPDREVALAWNGQRSEEARWRFGPDRADSCSTVADASVIHENPFYVIPFRHTLRADPLAPGATDLSLAATRSCRIEYYDADEQRTLAIDATGDGSFDGRGDALFADDDRSGYPDVHLGEDGAPKQIELWVYPSLEGVRPGDETELTLSLFKQGEWVPEAVDILVHADSGLARREP